MKNKFLLLGATALLSTGALTVFADSLPGVSDSDTLNITAEIVKDLNIDVKQHINFGRIAWDFSAGENVYLTLTPDSSGNVTPVYNGVRFHDGEYKVGKVCVTDLVPSATLNTGISLSTGFDYQNIIRNGDQEIGEVDFSDLTVDAGATDGIRCFYIGANLIFYNNDAAKDFSGNIEEAATVTVTFQ